MKQQNGTYISVVIPVLNEESALQPLYEELLQALKNVTEDFEFIFVDDGSIDHTSQIIDVLHRNNPRVKLIQFRRNFGKSAALSAGFKEASGKIVITIDGDLQDDPKEIPRFIKAIEEGYDLVSGWKHKRKDSLTRTLPSKIFNWVVPALTGVRLHDLNCGFKAYRLSVVKDLRIYGELHRYIPILAGWKGYRIGEIAVNHHPRRFGKSRYGAERFIRGLLDFVTVYFLTRYLKRPLHLFGGIGLVCLSFGFLINAYFGFQWIIGFPLHLRPIMIFGWVLLIMGLQFVLMGLIGEMIAHMDGNRKDVYEVKRKLK